MSDLVRLVVLASGSGTNLQAILDAASTGNLPAKVVAVFSDQKSAYALQRAEETGIPAILQPWDSYLAEGKSRTVFDADLAKKVLNYQPDYVVLAGWMRLLSMEFLSHFPMRVINLHPALPGCYPGTHAIERAYHDYKDGLIKETGVMIHYVPDEGVDNGPLIVQQRVPIFSNDTLETLTDRIHQVEHQILVHAIKKVITANRIND